MNLQSTLENYLNELSSGSPTPGGGNVSALCGVLAAALGQMVCSLTIGKKKYLEVEDEFKKIKEELGKFGEEFRGLAERDNRAFEKVMQSFKLPKDTDAQIEERSAAIKTATMEAAIVPAEVITKCGRLLPYLESIAEKGNRNSISDAGVALSLTKTAAEGAFLNVVINCSSLSNRAAADKFMKESDSVYTGIKEKADNLIASIIKNLEKT